MTITGANLVGATAVEFGTTAATTYTVILRRRSSLLAPPKQPGRSISPSPRLRAPRLPRAPTSTPMRPLVARRHVGQPGAGSVAGATSVTIVGTNLSAATAVDFGATAATSYVVNSATSITAVSPAESAGIVDITVTTSAGTSATSSADQFTYESARRSPRSVRPRVPMLAARASPSPVRASPARAVDFGATAATSYTVNSTTSITAVSPAASNGTVNITVTTPGGTSTTSSADDYTYNSSPAVTAVSPTSGRLQAGLRSPSRARTSPARPLWSSDRPPQRASPSSPPLRSRRSLRQNRPAP